MTAQIEYFLGVCCLEFSVVGKIHALLQKALANGASPIKLIMHDYIINISTPS